MSDAIVISESAAAQVIINEQGATGIVLSLPGVQCAAVAGTDLAYDAATRVLSSSTGTNATLPEATTTVAGLQSAADKLKLDGIAAGATANATDSQLRDRATHTGTQDVSTVTGALSATDAAATYQPLDSDLTAIAALTTTTFGRELLTQADAAATRTTIGAGTSSVAISSATPQPLGTAAAGTTGQASDAGHVHASPPLVSTSNAGLVPETGTPSGKYLKDDGTWADVPAGGATPAGSGGQIQFHDGQDPAGLGASADLSWDNTGKVLEVGGDINLDDGVAGFVTTLQLVTPTANRTIAFPDATGTVALVGGSTGQLLYNLNGAVAGTGIIFDATTGTRFTLPFGYGAGAGGAVTQATSKSTAVTLHARCGTITMNAAALADATTVSFTLTNNQIAATDVVILNHASAGTAGAYTLNAQAGAGSASINVRNVSGGSLSEAIVIRFAVVKATTA